jgi:hypothetical protein
MSNRQAHKQHAVHSFALTVRYPGCTTGPAFRLSGTNKETLGKRGAEILCALAASKGISPLALDYRVQEYV